MSEKRYWFRVYDTKFEERIEKQVFKNEKSKGLQVKMILLKLVLIMDLTMLESSDKLKIEEFLKRRRFFY